MTFDTNIATSSKRRVLSPPMRFKGQSPKNDKQAEFEELLERYSGFPGRYQKYLKILLILSKSKSPSGSSVHDEINISQIRKKSS